MKGSTLTNWRNPDDFLRIYTCLFSEGNIYERFEEVSSTISLWTYRGELPVAVDSTFNFVNVILRDLRACDAPAELERMFDLSQPFGDQIEIEANASFVPVPPSSISLAYSSAIVRFVNGVVDSKQQKMYAQPVSKLAELQGLPHVFVDARHEATHDRIPSLEYLRHLSLLALRWLKAMYWDGMNALYLSVNLSIQTALEKYHDACQLAFSKTDTTHPHFNINSLPRSALNEVSAFYSEYEFARYSFSVQRAILSTIIGYFMAARADSTYEAAVWSHFLTPMVNDSPFAVELILGTLLPLHCIAQPLLERIFQVWLGISSTMPLLLINNICEILFLHLPTDCRAICERFLRLIKEKHSASLHPLLNLLIDADLSQERRLDGLNSLDQAKPCTDSIKFIDHWRISPLGSVSPIF